MKSMLFAALAACVCVGGIAIAAPVPPSVASAVGDKARPSEDVARDAERKPAEMLVFAGIKPGDKVVDVMPGKGYFTRIFAKAVGPKGHVYAYFPSEIDAMLKGKPPSITAITNDTANYPNVSLVHASLAKFAVPQSVDVVWTSQNYHDFHNPSFGPIDIASMNKAIFNALKPGGTYIVLDHAAEAGSGTRDTNTLHRIDPAQVKQEVAAAGFQFVGEDAALKNAADDHKKAVFDPAIRGRTDQFVFKFRKPAK
jgi:predicted methyltransferase